ncbi:MBL fold metallo-hydrolase [Euzebya sp.]|uniref:MBL fold metallo-hydrolase n=1 Tax=Euzebya sp. TaxID=1971409 RepID=UPI003514126D
MPRELVVLGTASQAPTRTRNHNGYLLRWDELGLLVDPGEGTQRQMLLAGVRTSQISHIAVTHHHGDHVLGLPGVLQRMALDQRRDPIPLIHPAEAGPHLDRLLGVGLYDSPIDVHRVPLPTDRRSTVPLGEGRVLVAEPLDHRVPTLGYRLQEPDRRAMDPHRLAAEGLEGPIVGVLERDGVVDVDGRTVRVEDVSHPRPGQAAALVMDTRECAAIGRLLRDVDLAVVEATFLRGDEALAERHGHLTADAAGAQAAAAGVRRLVVTHFSQRYADEEVFAEQARAHHPDVVAARDLVTIPVPAQRR